MTELTEWLMEHNRNKYHAPGAVRVGPSRRIGKLTPNKGRSTRQANHERQRQGPNGYTKPNKKDPHSYGPLSITNKVTETHCSTDDALNSLLNNPRPNTHYKVKCNGRITHNYFTDHHARTVTVEAELSLLDAQRGESIQQKAGGKDRTADDHGGHLIANEFGGDRAIINIVPMDNDLNGSSLKLMRRDPCTGGPDDPTNWYDMERMFSEALKEGKRVYVYIKVGYEKKGGGRRPNQFGVTYRISDSSKKLGELKNIRFINDDPRRSKTRGVAERRVADAPRLSTTGVSRPKGPTRRRANAPGTRSKPLSTKRSSRTKSPQTLWQRLRSVFK